MKKFFLLFFLDANLKLKAVYKKNARQQHKAATENWALAELLNTLRTVWLGAYTLCQTISRVQLFLSKMD